MGNFKWYVLVEDRNNTTIVVKGYYTKEEALTALTKLLEEEPDSAKFYTIRKEEEAEFMFKVIW